MKKLLSLITVLLCALALSTTAFAADTDAFSIYQKYVKKSKSISSMQFAVTQKFSLVSGDESFELTKQTGTVKMLIMPDDKLQMEVQLSDSATKETAYAYYKDNYLYEKVGNEQFKIKMNIDEAMASTAQVDLSLTQDALKDAKVEQVDGGTKITYKTKLDSIDDTAMASLFQDLDLPNDIKMSISNVTSTLTINDDGSLKSTSNVYSVTISDGKDSFKFKVSQNAQVGSINTVTKINFPADLSAYKAIA